MFLKNVKSWFVFSIIASAMFLFPFFSQAYDINVRTDAGLILPGQTVYAFTETGIYTGYHATSDLTGTAFFDTANFPDGAYKFRLDYLGNQFWSELVSLPTQSGTGIVIDEETVAVKVISAGGAGIGVKVYLFSEAGGYLGLY